ncbi:MAG: hypothetical protein HZC42_14165 [Candidatus Eisenbacteria bacterium]|nr:hypothetical protein [Candidatus Eisenbacteria bacterium]
MPVGIAAGRRSPREWLPALVLALAVACPAGADVVVKEKTVAEGLGGFGDGTTSRTLIVAGDKSRSEDEFTYTGRLKTFVGGKPRTSISIIRVDRELIWNVEPEKKKYTELTFAQMRAMMERGAAEMDKAAAEQQPKDAEMTFTVDVRRTGAKQSVNGFPAEQVVITCTGKPKSPQQGAEAGEIRLVMDQWLTRGAPGSEELTAFYRKFSEKLGLDQTMSGISPVARRMYGNAMKEMASKLKGLEGWPVKSTFTIERTQLAAAAEAQAQAATAAQGQREAAKAEHAKAEQETRAEEKRQDEQEAKDIGSEAASGGGGVAGKLGGFLGRKLAKSAQKKAEEHAEKKADEMTAPSTGPTGGALFKVVTEVLGISTSPAPAGSFEVPAGCKLQKSENR